MVDEHMSAPDQGNAGKGAGPFIIVVVVLLLAIGAWALLRHSGTNTTNDKGYTVEQTNYTNNGTTNTPQTNQTELNTTTTVTVPPVVQKTDTFLVTAQNFSFSLKEMRVKKGDKVRITLTNTEGSHDLVIDAFNVNTGRLAAGETKTVEFIASKTGTFEYYCSVGEHRNMGMKGNLIVE